MPCTQFGLVVDDDAYCQLAYNTNNVLTLVYYLSAIGLAVYTLITCTKGLEILVGLAAASTTALLAPFALDITALVFAAACCAGNPRVGCRNKDTA